jgi:UDP-glucose 4-epimerase
MKYLVTGGAGFIGCNIALWLRKEGHQVIVIDDLSLGMRENLGAIQLERGDVRDRPFVDWIASDVDGIFHEAAKSSAPMFYSDPRDGLDININGFTNVLEAARKYDLPVVYATTSSLYSRCPIPHSESQKVVPGSFYELSMFTREKIAKLYAELYGLHLVGLRYFSVYGPHEQHKGKYANNISQFLWDIAKGNRPVLFGDGSQTRDFTYVDDVVEANILAMRSRLDNEIINVGTGVSHSFNSIVEKLNSAMGTTIAPRYTPNKLKNYVAHTLADTAKAERLLNFKAKTSVDEGIKRIVRYYSSLKK